MYSVNYKNGRSSKDAFLLLLKKYKEGKGKEDGLDNLFENVKKYMEKRIKCDATIPNFEFTQDDFQKLLAGKHTSVYISELFKNNILDIAYETIGTKGTRTLGNYVPIDSNGKPGFNSSSWFCHVLQAAEFAADLAAAKGLDVDTARKLAILHDIGRTKDHTFRHVTEGAKILESEGWNEEATICLTHSFLTGDIAAMNEIPPEGWNLDEKGNVIWKNGQKTEMAKWLDNYKCNEYDLVMQLADLLVEQRGKVDIKARLEGIKKRREAKGNILSLQSNRALFLTKLYNAVLSTMQDIDTENKEIGLSGYEPIDLVYVQDGKYNKRTVQEIENLLYGNQVQKEKSDLMPLSDYFSEFYNRNIKGKAEEKNHEIEVR